jgi:DNA-binding SARP family transcriptional activator
VSSTDMNSAAVNGTGMNGTGMDNAAVAEVRAFGPLTVAGRTVPRPRERTLLALLVAAHGQPVSGSRLAGQLWHGEPPPSAQTALQVAASRLRALVEPDRPPRGPARRVVSVGDGYALRLPADAVDVWRFAAAARRATGAPAGDRVARCDEALGWWTGTPYADCADTHLVRGEVDRLTETRLSLLEARASALLDLGRPDVVVRELALVAREHPFREGLWSLLALGQYRTLRQADALATLRELRRRLAGELGIDPSAQLRELETGILRQAPELAGPPAAVSASAVAAAGADVQALANGSALAIGGTPDLVGDDPDLARGDVPAAVSGTPAAGSGLVGRDAALAVLTDAADRLLAGHGGAAIVSGEAGIGKSELVAAVRRYAAAHGAAIAVGRCHEADLAPAFWPWLPVLRQLTGQPTGQPAGELAGELAGQFAGEGVPREIAPLLDAGRDDPEPGGAAMLRTYDAMARLVADAGRRQPLLLVVEDVHWADASSLRALAHLVGTPDAPVLVLVTRRTAAGPRSDALVAALAALTRAGALRIRLDGLGDRDRHGHLDRWLDRQPADLLYQRCTGRPWPAGRRSVPPRARGAGGIRGRGYGRGRGSGRAPGPAELPARHPAGQVRRPQRGQRPARPPARAVRSRAVPHLPGSRRRRSRGHGRLGPGGPAHRRGGEGAEEGHLRDLHLPARQRRRRAHDGGRPPAASRRPGLNPRASPSRQPG